MNQKNNMEFDPSFPATFLVLKNIRSLVYVKEVSKKA